MARLFALLAWCYLTLQDSAVLAKSTSTSSTSAAPVTTWAPIPAQAIGPNLTHPGWRVEHFGGGAYMVTDNQYNGIFLVSTKGVIIVDAPPTIGWNMVYAVGNTTDIPITHVVYSHAHADHIGGAFVYGKKVKRIAHELTKEILAATPDDKRPLPDTTFKDDYTLSVGNQTLKLSYKGLNHQPGNIFIYAPIQKVLMLVDIIYPGWTPFAYLGQGEFIPGVMKAHNQSLEYSFDHFVGGHLSRSGDRHDVEVARTYIEELYTNCARAIVLSGQAPGPDNPVSVQTLLPPVLAANPNNLWAEFKAYNDQLAEYCGRVTNEKWIGRLGAVDTYAFENAYAMVESLRLDFDVLGPFGVQ